MKEAPLEQSRLMQISNSRSPCHQNVSLQKKPFLSSPIPWNRLLIAAGKRKIQIKVYSNFQNYLNLEIDAELQAVMKTKTFFCLPEKILKVIECYVLTIFFFFLKGQRKMFFHKTYNKNAFL